LSKTISIGKRCQFKDSYPLYILFCAVNIEGNIVYAWSEPIETLSRNQENNNEFNLRESEIIEFEDQTMYLIEEERNQFYLRMDQYILNINLNDQIFVEYFTKSMDSLGDVLVSLTDIEILIGTNSINFINYKYLCFDEMIRENDKPILEIEENKKVNFKVDIKNNENWQADCFIVIEGEKEYIALDQENNYFTIEEPKGENNGVLMSIYLDARENGSYLFIPIKIKN